MSKKKTLQTKGVYMDYSAEAIAEARRRYQSEYRAKNKDKVNEYSRKWNTAHPEKQAAYMCRFWMKKMAEYEEAERKKQIEERAETGEGDKNK